MPTILPHGSPRRRLTLWESAELVVVLVRMTALNDRMSRVASSIEGPLNEHPELRAAARSWCKLSARLAAVTGKPEHPDAAELRALFGTQDRPRMSLPAGKPACGQSDNATEGRAKR